MSLDGARIWLATRGGERARFYHPALIKALESAGAASVEVVGLPGLLRVAASDLGTKATDLFGTAAGRLARGLRVDRFLGMEHDAAEGPAESDASSTDLVIVDDPSLPLGARAALRLKGGDPVTVGLIDDLCVDTRWRDAKVHALIVPHEALRSAHSAPDSGVIVEIAGPPASSEFVPTVLFEQAHEELSAAATRVIVVAAEGMHPDTLERAVFQLTLLDEPAQILFHHGESVEIARDLRRAAASYGLEAKLLGNVDALATVFAGADVILAGASDPGVLDLLLSHRPVVLIGADRGAARALFLADMGAVVHVEDVLQLSSRLDELFRAEGLQGLVERAVQIVTEEAVEGVVAALGRIYAQREQILAQTAVAPEPEPRDEVPTTTQPIPAGKPTLLGSFESIGSTVGTPTGGELLAPITMAEAKDQMAALILRERDADRGLTEMVKDRDRWLDRLELAREGQDTELVQVAESRLAVLRTEVSRLNAEIEMIRRSKAKLKERVARRKAKRPAAAKPATTRSAAPSPSEPDYEARFRTMELERDMNRLRRKIGKGDSSGGKR